MTTPRPESGDHTVPPSITEDMLPPVPPRPATQTVAAVLLGLFWLAILGGNLWELVAEADTSGRVPAVWGILLPLALVLLGTAAIAALARLLWLGSMVGSILTAVVIGYTGLTTGPLLFELFLSLSRGDSPRSYADRYLDDPGAAGVILAAACAPAIVVLVLLPVSWRWSRKAGMIRQIRALIRKGRPVTRLPQQIFD